METRNLNPKPTRGLLGTMMVLGILVAGAIALHQSRHSTARVEGVSGAVSAQQPTTSETKSEAKPDGDRTRVYRQAVERRAQKAATWPKTESELLTGFWQAASRKDFAQLILYCPGAVEKDFRQHMEKWIPSEAKHIGPPEPHPRDPKVTLYPVTVDFPGYPNKTVKMAVTRMSDGLLGIDGQHTIWW